MCELCRACQKALNQWVAALFSIVTLSLPLPAVAEALTVAVASNFAEALEAVTTEFERHSGHRVSLVRGSSGRHYAQARSGAPFDLLLSADGERPERLASELGLPPDRVRTYALGLLVLWSPDTAGDLTIRQRLEQGDFQRLAIANPRLAPYGQAAVEVLEQLGLQRLLDGSDGRLVRGENVAQTYQFVATGNAQLGFVALSQLALVSPQQQWVVPEELYQPIVQKLVILNDRPASLALADFLRGAAAREIIQRFGYRLPPSINQRD
jgi:molybdate transport system substrate-binding protein